jgi:hypothetical protein
MTKFLIRIIRKGCRETLLREVFHGTELEAEQRLGELWNKHCAHDGNDRFRAIMTDYPDRNVRHTIN